MALEVAQDHRVLKRVVIGLGILLIVGTLGLMALIAKKMKSPATAAPSASLPAELILDVPPEAAIEAMALGPSEVALTISEPGGRRILILDRRSGKIRQSLRLGSGSP